MTGRLLAALLVLPLLVPPLAAPRVRWRVSLGRAVSAEPVVTRAGLVIVGLQDSTIAALDGATGRAVWSCGTSDPPRALSITASGPPLVVAGTMSVERDRVRGPLLALDAVAGRPRWRFEAPGAFPEPPVAAPDGRLLVTSSKFDGARFADTLHALDAASGRRLWSAAGLEASINALACAPDGRAFVTGFHPDRSGTRLHRVDRNGRRDWSTTIRRDSNGFAPLALHASGLVFTGGEDHELVAIRPGEGVAWRCRLARMNAGLARMFGPDRLVVCSYGEGKRALDGIDVVTRRVIWTNQDRRWIGPFGELPGGTLVCCESGAPALHALSIRDGRVLWSFALPDLPAGFAVGADRTIYVACRGGEVLALHAPE